VTAPFTLVFHADNPSQLETIWAAAERNLGGEHAHVRLDRGGLTVTVELTGRAGEEGTCEDPAGAPPVRTSPAPPTDHEPEPEPEPARDPGPRPAPAGHRPLSERVLELVTTNPNRTWTAGQVAEHIPANTQHIATTLSHHCKAGRVERVARGKYRAPGPDPAELERRRQARRDAAAANL
jgi:hypothetical protein